MEAIPTVKILPPSESAEIGGRNPNCEKNPNVKILPRSESAEIGGEYPNCEKVPTVKTSPRSGSAETSPDLGPLLPGSWDRPAAADKEECTVFAFNNKVRTFSLSVDKKASIVQACYFMELFGEVRDASHAVCQDRSTDSTHLN